MENESKRGSTATLSAGMWTGPGLILNGGLARFYCNLYKMYKTWTFPKIRPLILPLTIGSEKQQVKKTLLHYRGVSEAKNCGKKYKDTVLSSPPLCFPVYLCFLYELLCGEKFQSIFLAGSPSKSMLHLRVGTALWNNRIMSFPWVMVMTVWCPDAQIRYQGP